MSTTLTNGLKLPDKGSVDWYADMQNNYTILDGAVGTIADHTTAIAGKAASSHIHTKSDVTDLLNSNFIPSANNSYDLGSSSYQWNNLYAKRTYTSMLKAATGDLIIQSNGTNKSVAIYNGTLVGDGGGIWLYGKDHANGSKVRLQIYNTTTSGYEGVDLSDSSLYPAPNNLLNLGTSTNKWKSLNGVNPGALSLPSASYIDISSSITDRNYGANYYTAPSNGYVCIGSMASSLQISNDTLGFGISAGTAQDGYSSVYIPVRTGDTVRILLNQTSTDYQTFRFYSCAGNV